MESIDEETCITIIENKLEHRRFQLMKFEENYEMGKKGLLSDYGKLDVKVRCNDTKRNEQISFFIKYFPEVSTNKVMQNFVTFHECFQKEILTYQYFEEVKNFLNMRELSFMPRCYYCKYGEFLVLEDLSALGFKNATIGDMDVLHSKLILQNLAKLQATNIAFDTKKSLDCSFDGNFDLAEDKYYLNDKTAPFYKYMNSSKKGLLNMRKFLYGHTEDTPQFEEKLEHYFEKIFKKLKTYRNVLSHGDLWRGNTLFRYDKQKPIDCKIIDFQTTCYNVPAFDVLFSIFSTITSNSRKLYFHELLNFFYDTLNEELKIFGLDINVILPHAEFRTTCRMLLPQIKLLIILQGIVSVYGKDVKMYREDAKKYEEFLFDDRSPLILEMLRKDEIYKAAMVDELMVIEDIFKNTIITIEDCNLIIQNILRSKNYQIRYYQLKPCTDKNGFLGEHFELDIQIEHKSKIQNLPFFVKSLPNTADLKQLCLETGTFFKESKFFNKLVPFLKKHDIHVLDGIIPECFFACESHVIVLENLSKKGFRIFASRAGLELDVIELVLDTLAKFHSSCIILEEIISQRKGEKYRILQEFGDEFQEVFHETKTASSSKTLFAFKQGISAIIDSAFVETCKSDRQLFEAFAHKALDSQKDYVIPSSKYRNTICHSDFWTKNFMIKSEGGKPTDCVILDFQTYRYCPPAQDLMVFIYLNTSKLLRNEHLYYLKEYYYKQLEKQLNKHSISIENIINRSEFFECCDYYEQFAITQALSHFQVVILRPDVLEELFSDQDKLKEAFFGNKYNFIRDMWSGDDIFRNKLTEIINELKKIYDRNVLIH